jgi:hypothetical protein
MRTIYLLLIFVCSLPQISCAGLIEEEVGGYEPVEVTPQLRQGLERMKREFLQLEDIKVGDGPIAAWGRKISADIEVKYADGTLIYRGPAIAYVGMKSTHWIHDDIHDRGMLSLQQEGLILGLNGMAVGGKRRMVIAPNLVCYAAGTVGQSTAKGADPRGTCYLVVGNDEILLKVRKETLIVEATLTASCIPGFIGNPRVFGRVEIRCRDSKVPRREPGDTVWTSY